jgi:tRNA-binding protein
VSETWDEFERLDLRVGVITEVEDFPEARDPAYKLTIDFGGSIGIKRIAGFSSEVLVLGAYSAEHGVVLLRPDREVEPGSAIG